MAAKQFIEQSIIFLKTLLHAFVSTADWQFVVTD
jgi:hypothetical protein